MGPHLPELKFKPWPFLITSTEYHLAVNARSLTTHRHSSMTVVALAAGLKHNLVIFREGTRLGLILKGIPLVYILRPMQVFGTWQLHSDLLQLYILWPMTMSHSPCSL